MYVNKSVDMCWRGNVRHPLFQQQLAAKILINVECIQVYYGRIRLYWLDVIGVLVEEILVNGNKQSSFTYKRSYSGEHHMGSDPIASIRNRSIY